MIAKASRGVQFNTDKLYSRFVRLSVRGRLNNVKKEKAATVAAFRIFASFFLQKARLMPRVALSKASPDEKKSWKYD